MFSNLDLRKLLIPLIIEQLLSGLMGIADTMMVTTVGDTAISAVSCVDSINMLVLYLVSALATGGTIICSQYLGRQDRKNAALAGQQVYLVAITLSVLISVFCLVIRRQLLTLIFGQVEPAIMDQAMDYFLITIISYPFLALQQTSAAQFRASGNSKLPMMVTAVANVTNIAGNALLIFVFEWGVVGAAVATLASRILNAVILLICQRNENLPIPFRNYRQIRPQKRLIGTICRIAIPTGMENGLFQLGKLLVQSTVATLGTTAIAAQAMTHTLDTIQSLPSLAVGIGLLTVAGQCVGAGKIEEAKVNTKKLIVVSWVTLMIFSVILLLLTNPICNLSGLSTDATTLTFRMMVWITIAKAFFWVPSFTLPNTLRASGDVTFSAIVSAVSMWVFRVLLSVLLCRVLGFGLEGVWIAWFADWICRMCFYIWRYKSGKWTKKHVIE